MLTAAERLAADVGNDTAERPKAKRAPVNGEFRLFDQANGVDTVAVLDRLGIPHTNSMRGEMATCPGCGEDGALVCSKGGVKCLHARCSQAGPAANSGFRTNVDLVGLSQQLTPLEAAKRICQWFGIDMPKGPTKTLGVPPVDDDYVPSDDDAPDAPPAFEAFGMDRQAAKLPLLKILGAAEIFAPLPPLVYLVDQLVVRGTALQILAYGSSGKSWVGMHMAVACAAGSAFLGRFPTTKCRALYLDFENGSRESMRRIQANAKARGIGYEGLTLGLCSMPSMYLDDPRFIAEIRNLATSYDLFIVDTLRAATRGEENASDARRPIDSIKAVIEETKGALVVLSHCKKTSQSVTKIDPREQGRGSSAIFDAFDAVLHLAYEEGQPLLATQTKGRSGRFVEPFGIEITDTDNGGVDVLAGDAPETAKEAPSGAFAAKCDAAVAFLKTQPAGATGRTLRETIKCNGLTMSKVTEFLVRNGIIEDRSTRSGSPVWYYRGSLGQ